MLVYLKDDTFPIHNHYATHIQPRGTQLSADMQKNKLDMTLLRSDL